MSLIFVDTETGGFEAPEIPLVELSYATLDSEVKTLYFGVEEVAPYVDELIGFTERGIAGRRSANSEIKEFIETAKGQTMVAANPAFDKYFLAKDGLFVFHYRTLDIQSWAEGRLGLWNGEPPSMKQLYDWAVFNGFQLTKPDHTSRNDVLAMREIYNIIKDY